MTQPAKPHPLRTAVVWIVRTGVSVGLLYYLTRNVDLSQILGHLRTASVGWLSLAMALYAVMVSISTWRWQILLQTQHVKTHYASMLKSFLVATYFNNFLPSNIGGDVVRIGDTARAAGSKTRATTVVFIDRVAGLLGLFFVAALGSTVVANRSAAVGPGGPGVLWALFGLGLIAAGILVFAPELVGRILAPIGIIHREWVDERLAKLTSSLSKFKAAPGALGMALISSIVIQAILVGFYASVARALHIEVPLNHLGILIPLSFVVQMLPVSIGGLGVREGLFQKYFAGLGLNPDHGLELSLVGFGLMVIFSISGAIIYMTRKRH